MSAPDTEPDAPSRRPPLAPHDRAARAALSLAVEVPAILLGLQGGVVGVFGWAFALVAVVSTRVGGRVALPLWAAVPLHVLIAFGSLALHAATLRPARPAFGVAFTVACLALSTPALLWRLRASGRAVISGIGLVALMGMARATTWAAYVIAVGAFLGFALLSALLADPAWRGLLARPRGRLVPLLSAFAVAGVLMTGIGVVLPAAEPAVSAAIRGALFDDQVGTSGFSDAPIRLGDLRQIVTSDKVVLRVFGPADHLRGQVYVDYAYGQWNGRRRPELPVPERDPEGNLDLRRNPTALAPEGKPVRIEALALAGRMAFAPLGTMGLRGLPEGSRVDAYGAVALGSSSAGDDVSYAVVAGPTPERLLAPPDDRDLFVPAPVREPLAGLAQAWTQQAASPAAKVDALVARLAQDYRYSLEPEIVPAGLDPIVHFLTASKRGHCEYFASSLALLTRTLGVPTRMLGGYRVFEFNAAGGYHIVRQRDAHAWVEVYLDGAWRTVDPTPPGSLAGESARTAGVLGGAWDRLKRGFDQAFEWLAALTFEQITRLALWVGVGVLLWLAVRWRPKKRAAAAPEAPRFGPLEALERSLARRGAPMRDPTEPPAHYAERLRVAGHPEAAAAVEVCAAWLYGGEGDAAAIAAEISALIEGPQRA